MVSWYYYCWWKKSCASSCGKYPIVCRVLYIPGGARFLPSTVSFRSTNLLYMDLICSPPFGFTHTVHFWYKTLEAAQNFWKQHNFYLFFWFHHRLQVTWSLRLDPSRYPFQYLGDSPCLRRTDFSLTLWRSTWVLVGGRPVKCVKCVKCNATKVHEFTIQQWYDTHLLSYSGLIEDGHYEIPLF